MSWANNVKASKLYLTASLLNLLSSTWRFAYAIEWLLQDPRSVQRPYIRLLDIILSRWPTGAVLCLAFFIAIKSRRSGGVWSQTAYYESGHKRARFDY